MESKRLILVVGGAAQGQEEYAAAVWPNASVIRNYHEEVRKQLENGLDPNAELDALLVRVSGQDTVLITNELGCGLVPMDRFEREYREVNGRINCRIAARADEVYRVLCGIGQRLK